MLAGNVTNGKMRPTRPTFTNSNPGDAKGGAAKRVAGRLEKRRVPAELWSPKLHAPPQQLRWGVCRAGVESRAAGQRCRGRGRRRGEHFQLMTLFKLNATPSPSPPVPDFAFARCFKWTRNDLPARKNSSKFPDRIVPPISRGRCSSRCALLGAPTRTPTTESSGAAARGFPQRPADSRSSRSRPLRPHRPGRPTWGCICPGVSR